RFMNVVVELIRRVEQAGGTLTLDDGGRITYELPDEAVPLLDQLRARKDDIRRVLRERQAALLMLPGVRLIEWKLKGAPVVIDVCSIVIDPNLFVRTIIEQLCVALENLGQWIGWSVPLLIGRLGQVGVVVELCKV